MFTYSGEQRETSLNYNFIIQRFEVAEEDFQSRMFYNPSLTECEPYSLEDTNGDDLVQSDCPVDNISFSEAAYYANLLSIEEELEVCYECTGTSSNVDYSVLYTSDLL